MSLDMHPLAAKQYTDQRFRVLWRALNITFRRYPHAFHAGCGRDSMAAWVWSATGSAYGKGELRWALNEAYQRGWTDRDVTPGRCTRYSMKATGRISPREASQEMLRRADMTVADISRTGLLSRVQVNAFFARLTEERPVHIVKVASPLDARLRPETSHD